MASVQAGHDIINVVRDGKVEKFRLKLNTNASAIGIQGQNSKPTRNQFKDVWIYKPQQKIAVSSQGQSATHSQMIPVQPSPSLPNTFQIISSSQGQKKVPQIITTSQTYIVANTPQYIYTTSQSQLMNTTMLVNSSQLPVINGIRTLPSKSTNHNKILTTMSTVRQPKVIVSSLQQSRRIPQGDLDFNDFSLVDIEDASFENAPNFQRSFQCTECNCHFTNIIDQEQHENVHLGEVNYICDQCGKEFGIRRHFESHVKEHALEKKFECDVCHKKFDYRDNLIFHMRIHGEVRSYKCHLCHKKFGNKSMRDNHVLKHRQTGSNQRDSYLKPTGVNQRETYLKPTIANQRDLSLKPTGANQRDSYLQLTDANQQGSYVLLDTEKIQEPTFESNDLPVYVCDVCFKPFSDKQVLENHKKVHIKHERWPKVLVRKKTPPKELKFTCSKCQKVFFREHVYKCHVLICGSHEEKRHGLNGISVNCAFCKKDYSVPKQANNDGSQSIKFICEPCCTFLAQKSQVSGFTPRLENRFICNKCDKCFASEAQLRQHLDSHLSGKIFSCDRCDKHFGDEKSLLNHRECHVIQNKIPVYLEPYADQSNEPKTINRSLQKTPKNKSIRKSTKGKKIHISNLRPESTESLRELFDPITVENNKQFGPSKESRRKRSWSSRSRSPEVAESVKKNTLDFHDAERINDDADAGTVAADSDSDFLMPDSNSSEEEGLQDLKMFIKQEPGEFDETEFTLDNCTVFNAAPAREKLGLAFSIPEKVIKQEDPDIDKQAAHIKQEKINEEEMTIKDEPDLDLSGFSVKEENDDDDEEEERLMANDFEFTPFGDPVKKEEFLNI